MHEWMKEGINAIVNEWMNEYEWMKLHTEPEFTIYVPKSVLVRFKVSFEVDWAIKSVLENLKYNVRTYQILLHE
jgi:hypothetical protein